MAKTESIPIVMVTPSFGQKDVVNDRKPIIENECMTMKQYLLRKLSKGAKDTSGTATVEAVLWLPIFFAFFIFITDVSFIYYGQSQIYRIVQDANRNLSVGRLEDEDETEAFISTALTSLSPNSTINTTINLGTVTSNVVTPTSDLMPVGFMSILDINLFITSSHLVEY